MQISGATVERMLIAEFYPCALRSDEYVGLANVGSAQLMLGNWSLTDGEGTVTFLHNFVVPIGERIFMSANLTSFRSAFGRVPEVCLSDRTSVSCSGTFRLADTGDTLELRRPDGQSVDAVAYGDVTPSLSGWTGPPVPRIKQGEVAKRIAIGTVHSDTNGSSDWLPFREYRYGYTEIGPFGVSVPSGGVTAFLSPDCSLDAVIAAVNSAASSLRICAYELDSAPFCRALVEAVSRGVEVNVLVDGAPAGGLQDDEVACLSVLASAGAKVRTVNGNLSEGTVQHIGALHAKYVVVDQTVSVILSENFVRSGLPVSRVYGNRGWGVKVVDPSIAYHLSALFDSDSRSDRPDVRNWRVDPRHDTSAVLPGDGNATYCQGALDPLTTSGGARVEVFVSPDASIAAPFLIPHIERAGEVVISQFQADVQWDSRWTRTSVTSPLVASVISAMRDGARVRGLFDSSWFNFEGNKRIVSILSGVARNESLDGAFAQLDPRSPISILHNKGLILDGRRTLISSNNWCLSSFAKNRELALLVESEEVAAYFHRAFDMDWSSDTVPPIADAGPDRTVSLGAEVVLDASHSADDRVITAWSWDVGGDGAIDGTEPILVISPDRTGRLRIVLEVTDAWGNKGIDTVFVEVVDPSRSDSALLPERCPWWLAPSSALLGSLAGVMLARRRARSQG